MHLAPSVGNAGPERTLRRGCGTRDAPPIAPRRATATEKMTGFLFLLLLGTLFLAWLTFQVHHP